LRPLFHSTALRPHAKTVCGLCRSARPGIAACSVCVLRSQRSPKATQTSALTASGATTVVNSSPVPFDRSPRARRRLQLGSIAALAALLLPSCGADRAPEQTLQAYYAFIERGAYADAADLVRAKDGAPLDSGEHQSLIEAYRAAYGPAGGLVHVTHVRLLGTLDLGVASSPPKSATERRQWTFEAEGTTATPCLETPRAATDGGGCQGSGDSG